MPFPKHYYYSKTVAGGMGYTKTPGGAIMIDRIMAGQDDCFQLPGKESEERLKKVIIINDWCFDHLNSDAFNEHLVFLLAEGFKVYQVNGDELMPIQRSEEVFRRAKPVINQRQLGDLLSAHKIEINKTHIVDYAQVNALLGKDQRILDAKDLRKADLPAEDIDLILQSDLFLVYNSANFKVEWLIKAKNIAFNNHINGMTVRHLNAIPPKIKSITLIDSGFITFDDAMGSWSHYRASCEILNTSTEHLGSWFLYPYQTPFLSRIFSSLTHLTLHGRVNQLGQLYKLEHCKNLTTLTLQDANSEILTAVAANLPWLNTVSLSSMAEGDWDNITQFIRQKDHLESLSIQSATNIPYSLFNDCGKIKKLEIQGNFDEATGSIARLESLKELRICGSSISAKKLNWLLQNTPNLESLHIEKTVITGDLDSLHLPHLKKLVLENSLTAQQASQLINANTTLTELYLGGIELPAKPLLPQTALRTLKLNNVGEKDEDNSYYLELRAEQINPLLSPSLVLISLKEQTIKDEINVNLPHLKHIALDDLVILSLGSVSNILAHAPQLQGFDIGKLNIPKQSITEDKIAELPSETSLSSLTIRSLDGEEGIDCKNTLFHKLIAMTPHLTRLDMDLVNLDTLSLPNSNYTEVKCEEGIDVLKNWKNYLRQFKIIAKTQQLYTSKGMLRGGSDFDLNYEMSKKLGEITLKLGAYQREYHNNVNLLVLFAFTTIPDYDPATPFNLYLKEFRLAGKVADDFLEIQRRHLPIKINQLSLTNIKMNEEDALHFFKNISAAQLKIDRLILTHTAYNPATTPVISFNEGEAGAVLTLTNANFDVMEVLSHLKAFDTLKLTGVMQADFQSLIKTIVQQPNSSNRLKTVDVQELESITFTSAQLKALVETFPQLRFNFTREQLLVLDADLLAFCKKHPQIQCKGMQSAKAADLLNGEDAEAIPSEAVPAFNAATFLNSPERYISDQTVDHLWSQTMLINRLHQYSDLLLSDSISREFKEKITGGICSSVSKWFADTVSKEGKLAWKTKLLAIKGWNGEEPAPEEVHELLVYVFKYQLRQMEPGLWRAIERFFATVVGFVNFIVFDKPSEAVYSRQTVNDLAPLLQKKPLHPLFIENSWHRTCLLFDHNENQWLYFDPNFKNGEPQTFPPKDEKKLLETIHQGLGYGLSVVSFHEVMPKIWLNKRLLVNRFLESGGLLDLVRYDEQKLHDYPQKWLTDAVLDGFFLLEIGTNRPFWYLALTQNPQVASKIIACLNEAISQFGEEKVKALLTNSLQYLLAEEWQKVQTIVAKNAPDGLSNLLKSIDTTNWQWRQAKKKPDFNSVLTQLVKTEDLIKIQAKMDDESHSNSVADNLDDSVFSEEPLIAPPPALEPEGVMSAPKIKNPIEQLQDDLQEQKPSLAKIEGSKFKTWSAEKMESIRTLNGFDTELRKQRYEGKNVLVSFTSNEQITNYIHHLQSMKQPDVFIINTPEDLKCAGATIKIDAQGRGVIQQGSSGALHDFLVHNKNNAPRIIVNWSNFDAQKTVQANALLDDGTRCADGIDVPPKATIIGLHNPTAKGAYLGSDFNSRHKHKIHWPSSIQLPAVPLPAETNQARDNPVEITIDFFNESNWQGFLYGNWSLGKEALQFQKSELLKALTPPANPNALVLRLKNAPTDSPEFRFALNSMISGRGFNHLGQSYILPEKISMVTENGYTLEPVIKNTQLQLQQGLSQNYDYVLNPDTFASYFLNYRFEHSEGKDILTTTSGWLQDNKTLTLYQTRDMSLSAWARLLTEAQTHHCQLNVILAPGVSVPDEIKANTPIDPLTETIEIEKNPVAQLIISDDLSYSESQLSLENQYDLIIDASELTKGDLFYAVSGKATDTNLSFSEKRSAFWQTLMDGTKKVLLKGHLKPEIADCIAPLFKPEGAIYHNGELESPKGQLTVLTDKPELFAYVANQQQQTISLSSKLDLMNDEKANTLRAHYIDGDLEGCSYAYLNVLATVANKPENPHDLTLPLKKLPDFSHVVNDFDLSKEASDQFMNEREKQVFAALERQCTLFISGKSGVGKSTFLHELNKRPDVVVYFGDVEGWAKAENDGRKHLLFFDEANLKGSDFSDYTTLHSNPAGVSHGSDFYPVDLHKNDKGGFKGVCFAGNPADFSDDRNVPELFAERPNVVTFGPISNAYLYHEVLKPLMTDLNESEQEKIARLFLQSYQYVKSIDENAISARELQMMAYLLKAKTVLPEDNYRRAKWYAQHIALQCLPEGRRQGFSNWFEQQFYKQGEMAVSMPRSIGYPGVPIAQQFLLTPSHQAAYLQLTEMMQVREVKKRAEGKTSYGGLTGIVLEGEPGIGKSNSVIQLLLNQGLVKGSLLENFDYDSLLKKGVTPAENQRFYHLPATMNTAAKINLLKYAFHTGAVVVIDELNSSLIIEQLVNALLMGEDDKGRRAIQPGFTLIGTQNPVSMAGRSNASLAIQRRVLHCDFPDYTPAEMVQVLEHLGCDEEKALPEVYDFLQARRFARANNLQPEPCFRDLQDVGKDWVSAGFISLKTPESSPSVYRPAEGRNFHRFSGLSPLIFNAMKDALEKYKDSKSSLMTLILEKNKEGLEVWLDTHSFVRYQIEKHLAASRGTPDLKIIQGIITHYLQQKTTPQRQQKIKLEDLGDTQSVLSFFKTRHLTDETLFKIAFNGKKRRSGQPGFSPELIENAVDFDKTMASFPAGQRKQYCLLRHGKMAFIDVEKNAQGQLTLFAFNSELFADSLTQLPQSATVISLSTDKHSSPWDSLAIISELGKYPHISDYYPPHPEHSDKSIPCQTHLLPIKVIALLQDSQALDQLNKEQGIGFSKDSLKEINERFQLAISGDSQTEKTEKVRAEFNQARNKLIIELQQKMDINLRSKNLIAASPEQWQEITHAYEQTGMGKKQIEQKIAHTLNEQLMAQCLAGGNPTDKPTSQNLLSRLLFKNGTNARLALNCLDCYEGYPFLQLHLLECLFQQVVGQYPVRMENTSELSDEALENITQFKHMYIRVLHRLPYDINNNEFNTKLAAMTAKGNGSIKLIDFNVSRLIHKTTTTSRQTVNNLILGKDRLLCDKLDAETIINLITGKNRLDEQQLYLALKSKPLPGIHQLQNAFNRLNKPPVATGTLQHIALLKRVALKLLVDCSQNKELWDKAKKIVAVKGNLIDFNTGNYKFFHQKITQTRKMVESLDIASKNKL